MFKKNHINFNSTTIQYNFLVLFSYFNSVIMKR